MADYKFASSGRMRSFTRQAQFALARWMHGWLIATLVLPGILGPMGGNTVVPMPLTVAQATVLPTDTPTSEPSLSPTSTDTPPATPTPTETATLEPTATETITATATVTATATTTLTPTVTPEVTPTTLPPLPSGLSLQLLMEPASVSAGDLLTLTVVIINHGPSVVSGAVFSDDLPSGLVFQPHGTDSPLIIQRQLGWVSAALPDMAPDTSLTLRYHLRAQGPGRWAETLLTNAVRVLQPNIADVVAAADILLAAPGKSGAAVSARGGAIHASRRVTVQVPAGVVTDSTFMLVTPLREVAGEGYSVQLDLRAIVGTNRNANGQWVDAERALTTTATSFAQPVTVQFNLDGFADVKQLSPNWSPYVVTYDEASGVWIRLPNVGVDAEHNTLVVETTHFSQWGAGVSPNAQMLLLSEPWPSLFTGATKFSYPLWTPPGPGGLQPSLALNYSSGAIDGVLTDTQAGWTGLGWTLSTIEVFRAIDNGSCAPCDSGASVGNSYGFRNEFTLNFNGSSYPLRQDPSNAKRYYTQDQSFLYIERHTIPLGNITSTLSLTPTNLTQEWWEVKSQDGTVYQLGFTMDAEQVVNMAGYSVDAAHAPIGPWAAMGYAGEAANRVANRWRVNRVTDLNANTVLYTYREYPRTANNITYDQASYLSATVYAPYAVVFDVEARGGDVPAGADVKDWSQWDEYRLKTVRVQHNNSDVRRYWPTYTVHQNAPDNGTVYQTLLLTGLREEGVAADGVTTTTLPAIGFTYSDFYNRAPQLTRTDATVDFVWNLGSPAAEISVDTFFVRWTGYIQASTTDTYTFWVSNDDGARVWVNNLKVIEDWTIHGADWRGGVLTTTLTAGQLYPITVEYFEAGGGASMKLGWSNSTQALTVIPNSQLFRPEPNGGNGLRGDYYSNCYDTCRFWPYPRLTGVTNGYGGGVSYTYDSDARTTPDAGAAYRVVTTLVTEGMGGVPLKRTLAYGEAKYTGAYTTTFTPGSQGWLIAHVTAPYHYGIEHECWGYYFPCALDVDEAVPFGVTEHYTNPNHDPNNPGTHYYVTWPADYTNASWQYFPSETDGSLLGYGTVTETVWNGTAVAASTVHKFHTRSGTLPPIDGDNISSNYIRPNLSFAPLAGREYETLVLDGNGQPFNKTETAYTDYVTSTWGNDIHFVYASAITNSVWSANANNLAFFNRTLVTYTFASGLPSRREVEEYDQANQPYRRTHEAYYPNLTLWLINLPAAHNIYRVQVGTEVCGGTLAGWCLVNSTWNLYDTNSPPDFWKMAQTPHLIAQRQWLYDPAGNTFVDTKYDYDTWGNVLTTTLYNTYAITTSLGNGYSNPITSVVGYDAWHLFPVTMTNAVGQSAYTQYDYRLGLPIATTDPNGAVMTYEYDALGRPKAMYRPGDVTGDPSQRYDYYDTQTPSNIRSLQKPGSFNYAQRHFYDGLGRELQTHSARNVTVSGSSASVDIVSSVRYNALGQVVSQTVPYTVTAATGGGNPYTTTTMSTAPAALTQYDALGRPVRVTAPDGTASTAVYANGGAGQYLTTVDANGHYKFQITDALGRMTRVDETLTTLEDPFTATLSNQWSFSCLSATAGCQTPENGTVKNIGTGANHNANFYRPAFTFNGGDRRHQWTRHSVGIYGGSGQCFRLLFSGRIRSHSAVWGDY